MRQEMSDLLGIDFAGQTAVVTGGRGRIGSAVCRSLAAAGATVISIDLPSTMIEPLENVIDIAGDIADASTWSSAADAAAEHGGAVDIVIHAAAVVGLSELDGWSVDFEHQDPGLWKGVFDVNVTSIFGLVQRLRPMMDLRGAAVVLVSSIYGSLGPDVRIYQGTHLGNPAGYAASKGALEALTRWLATVLAPKIRVNAISLGGIYSGQSDSFVQRYSARVPLQRMAEVADVIGPICFLASGLSRYMTGSIVGVDGGLAAW